MAEDVEASVPLGSTDMGNVTQVMPGIHPIVGIDAGGASVHQPAFAAAAAGASADKAVVEGAIMLARTVVRLAETPAERDRVLERLARGWRHETHRNSRRMAGRSLRRRGDVAAAHPHPPGARAAGVRHHPVRRNAPCRCRPQPEGAARRDRLDLRLRSRARAAHRAAGRYGRAADGRPDRNALRLGRCPTSRTPAATTRIPRCCWARRSRWRRCPSCRSGCG